MRGDDDSWTIDKSVGATALGFKADELGAVGAHPVAAYVAVPIDLRHDWPKALREAGFDDLGSDFVQAIRGGDR